MSYATFPDVTARAGAFAPFFAIAGGHPDQTDIESILTDLTAEVDETIRSRGYNPALLSPSAASSLRDWLAYGALARALDAAPVGPDADGLKRRAWDVWNAAAAGLMDGTSWILVELAAGAGGQDVPGAGDFWSEEPDYPTPGDFAAADLNPLQAPAWAKGQTL